MRRTLLRSSTGCAPLDTRICAQCRRIRGPAVLGVARRASCAPYPRRGGWNSARLRRKLRRRSAATCSPLSQRRRPLQRASRRFRRAARRRSCPRCGPAALWEMLPVGPGTLTALPTSALPAGHRAPQPLPLRRGGAPGLQRRPERVSPGEHAATWRREAGGHPAGCSARAAARTQGDNTQPEAAAVPPGARRCSRRGPPARG